MVSHRQLDDASQPDSTLSVHVAASDLLRCHFSQPVRSSNALPESVIIYSLFLCIYICLSGNL
jgi:hypothetical protein